MKNAPLLLFCLLCVFAFNYQHAQTQAPNIFPVSSEVATLSKFVDTPTGTYSGVSLGLFEQKNYI